MNKWSRDINFKQCDSFWDDDEEDISPDDDLWHPGSTKLSLAIVDGEPSMPPLTEALLFKNLGESYRTMYEDCESRNMRMITAHEYLVLAQRGLVEYAKAKADPKHPNHQSPEKEIMDFKGQTITAFYQPKRALTDVKKVSYGFFHYERYFEFAWDYQYDVYNSLRSRPVVQLLEV